MFHEKIRNESLLGGELVDGSALWSVDEARVLSNALLGVSVKGGGLTPLLLLVV